MNRMYLGLTLAGAAAFNSFPSSSLGTQVFEAPLRGSARRQPIRQAIRDCSILNMATD